MNCPHPSTTTLQLPVMFRPGLASSTTCPLRQPCQRLMGTSASSPTSKVRFGSTPYQPISLHVSQPRRSPCPDPVPSSSGLLSDDRGIGSAAAAGLLPKPCAQRPSRGPREPALAIVCLAARTVFASFLDVLRDQRKRRRNTKTAKNQCILLGGDRSIASPARKKALSHQLCQRHSRGAHTNLRSSPASSCRRAAAARTALQTS